MDKWQAVPTASLFVQYHKPETTAGVEAGISFWQKASRLSYNDNQELHYEALRYASSAEEAYRMPSAGQLPRTILQQRTTAAYQGTHPRREIRCQRRSMTPMTAL